MIRDVETYKKEFDEEWEVFYKALSDPKYEDYFPGFSDLSRKEEMKTIFIRAFTSVVTRCFGWGLPKTMMVPFADCINHHNVDSTYELIHPVYHLAEEGDPERGP